MKLDFLVDTVDERLVMVGSLVMVDLLLLIEFLDVSSPYQLKFCYCRCFLIKHCEKIVENLTCKTIRLED